MAKVKPELQPLFDLINGREDELADVNIFRTAANNIQTTGALMVKNRQYGWWPPEAVLTLELPWKENKPRISRIPPGIYEAEKYNSPRFKRIVILLKGVPGRTSIEIHPGNTMNDTTGCILVGKEWGDINRDGNPDVIKSNQAMDKILSLLPDTFRVRIWDCIETNKETA